MGMDNVAILERLADLERRVKELESALQKEQPPVKVEVLTERELYERFKIDGFGLFERCSIEGVHPEAKLQELTGFRRIEGNRYTNG